MCLCPIFMLDLYVKIAYNIFTNIGENMELETEKNKEFRISLRLSQDLNEFVEKKAQELDVNKSHAIRSIIRALIVLEGK